jgi:hypothetical protein
MMDQYSKRRNIQFIMCTHSPEILSGAYKDEDCTLLHLKSPSDITPVGKRAVDEYSEALHRLGTSVSESFFYDGTVLVEGDSDVIFLEEGFPEIFKKYKIKDRGGRRDVERTAAEIQELERKGERVAPIYFIFDQDDEPTKLENSAAVRVLQWSKRCVENYMIDVPVIAELLKDPLVTRKPIASAGDVSRLLRDLAFQQLDEIAARQTYNSYGYLNSSLTKAELRDGGLSELASAFFTRMSKARASLPDTPRETWIQEFVQAAEVRKRNLLLGWEAKWRDLCDGKKLISDLHKKADLKVSEAAFKTRITRMMRDATSDNGGWLETFSGISSNRWHDIRRIRRRSQNERPVHPIACFEIGGGMKGPTWRRSSNLFPWPKTQMAPLPVERARCQKSEAYENIF